MRQGRCDHQGKEQDPERLREIWNKKKGEGGRGGNRGQRVLDQSRQKGRTIIEIFWGGTFCEESKAPDTKKTTTKTDVQRRKKEGKPHRIIIKKNPISLITSLLQCPFHAEQARGKYVWWWW